MRRGSADGSRRVVTARSCQKAGRRRQGYLLLGDIINGAVGGNMVTLVPLALIGVMLGYGPVPGCAARPG